MNEFSLSSQTSGLRVLESHHACVALYRPAGLLPQTRESPGEGLELSFGQCLRDLHVHPIILVSLAYGLHFVTLYPLLKYGLAVLIAVPCCFALGALVCMLPYEKRIF